MSLRSATKSDTSSTPKQTIDNGAKNDASSIPGDQINDNASLNGDTLEAATPPEVAESIELHNKMEGVRFQPVAHADLSKERGWANQIMKNHVEKVHLMMHPSMMLFVLPHIYRGGDAVTACMPDVNHNDETAKTVLDILNNAIGDPLEVSDNHHIASHGNDMQWVAIYSPVVSSSVREKFLQLCFFFTTLTKKTHSLPFSRSSKTLMKNSTHRGRMLLN